MYGLFNIVLAVGSAAGALLAGAAARPRPRVIVIAALAFGIAQAAAAIAPDLVLFLTLLIALGFVNLAFQAMANAYVQLAAEPEMRGRVMGLYMLVFIGGTPIGAPLVGVLTSHFGARAGMLACGAVPAVAALVIAALMLRRRLRRSPAASPGSAAESGSASLHRAGVPGSPPPARRPRRASRPRPRPAALAGRSPSRRRGGGSHVDRV
jgi:MFS family permease